MITTAQELREAVSAKGNVSIYLYVKLGGYERNIQLTKADARNLLRYLRPDEEVNADIMGARGPEGSLVKIYTYDRRTAS